MIGRTEKRSCVGSVELFTRYISYAVYFLRVGTVKTANIVHEEALGGFTDLTNQLSKMVEFFQMTSSIIGIRLWESLKRLTEQVEVTRDRSLAG